MDGGLGFRAGKRERAPPLNKPFALILFGHGNILHRRTAYMKDIAIWRVLTAEPPRAPDEVLATLRELAAAPAPDRLPLAGAAIRWLSDPHPEIRLLALEALAGAEGNFVVRRVAALLEDPELSVRKAATRVFCQAVRDTPLLWIVALFSPDSEVRAVAREHPPCAEADYLLGYFLFDEPIAPEVEARLLAARFPPPALLLFLRLFKKGRVPGRLQPVLLSRS